MPEIKPTVFGADAGAYRLSGGTLRALDELLDASGIGDLFKPGEHVGIKINIGQLGNIKYLRPVFIRAIVEKVLELGGTPVIFDTVGMVGNTIKGPNDWFYTATVNGFPGALLGKAIIPADGYTGEEGELLPVEGDELGGIEVARGIVDTSAIIVVSHVTGHPHYGMNGALFNKGVGCAAQKGKWRIYNPLKPQLDAAKCNNCNSCLDLCPFGAIETGAGSARINSDKCKGCTQYCLDYCPGGALEIAEGSRVRFQKRVVEAATAVNVAALGRLLYLNFLMDISKYPDYYTLSDQNLTPDLGILASKDPVAIDQASLDLINQAPGLMQKQAAGYCYIAPDEPKFEAIFGIDPAYPIKYAEEYGLGRRDYHLDLIGG